VRLPPVLFRPIAAEDVASAISEATLAKPVNGTIEIAGPAMFTMDQAIGKVLDYDKDARRIIADPTAPYFGVKVTERTLIPNDDARLGVTTVDWWLDHVPRPTAE
jgi:uncharacterized protein YbjT (DUF2867 family)